MSKDSDAMEQAFVYLLTPAWQAARNRVRHREPGDGVRGLVFGGVALIVFASIFAVVFWLSWQLLDYEELGEYLLRLGLGWLFLTFLSFLAFSGLVVSLSTFFLSDDLNLLWATPTPLASLFHSRFARCLGQASWMVLTFLIPVLLAVGFARCAGGYYYLSFLLVVPPFVIIPVALGTAVTLILVNTFPARRARDLLMLTGLLFSAVLILMIRYIRPERLLSIQSLPDIAAFFRTLESPITPYLPSFWAGEALFGSLQGRADMLHLGALWTTALALLILLRMAFSRFYLRGFSKAQEARKARFLRMHLIERLAAVFIQRSDTRSLVAKESKVFLRDPTQWSQLLLLLALAFVYVYNFSVLDLDRIPYMSGLVKSAYAFVNLAMAAFVLSAIAVRFVFPSVSAEGPAFWIIRTSPVSMRAFLWSKFSLSLVPILLLTLALTVTSNAFLGVDPFLKWLDALAIVCMAPALVGLATGMGAIYPRFRAENTTQVAGSFGGVAFMILAVTFILIEIALLAWASLFYLFYRYRNLPLPDSLIAWMTVVYIAALILCVITCLVPMRRGIRALEALEVA